MNKHLALICIPILIIISACTPNLMSPSQNTEEKLLQRVTQLWDARKNSDWGGVYDMFDQEYQNTTTREKFFRKSHLKISDYEIESLTIEESGEKAQSRVLFTTPKFGLHLKAYLKETWVFENNRWRMKGSKLKTPFDQKSN